ncbi:MAG TPA: hypothetical protein V6C97_33420 [Oculatellaceae cyanobacterium]
MCVCVRVCVCVYVCVCVVCDSVCTRTVLALTSLLDFLSTAIPLQWHRYSHKHGQRTSRIRWRHSLATANCVRAFHSDCERDCERDGEAMTRVNGTDVVFFGAVKKCADIRLALENLAACALVLRYGTLTCT